MAPSRRNTNGRSPLVNQQRQITSFFTKTPTPSPSPSPSPILSKSKPKLNPNPISNPNSTTPSPLNPKSHKPLLVIGASSTPSPSSYGEEVVGKRIKVYWPLDNAWYEGIVKSFDNITSKHLVRYDDDEEECVDLSKEKIEWPKDSSTKKLKRLRRGSSPLRKMVIEEDNEVEESIKEEEEEEHDSDDSEDEDWGKNAVLEDAGDDDDEEKDMELVDEDEDDVAEKRVELKKRKLGGAQKQEPTKKIKSGTEVNKGAFKLSVLEPINNLEGK